MNIFNNIFIKLAVFSSIYVIVLIFVAPFIDHLFTSLEEDKLIKETNSQILLEIICSISSPNSSIFLGPIPGT